jgi:DNA-binding response OmpR family regulator
MPNPPTILLVDDEPTLLDTLAYNLRREGYTVLTAADGPEAVRLAYEARPDLIILDVMLPGLSGLDVSRAVRRELTTPILMLSARDAEIDRVLGLELGADDYLTKPFSLRELLARVHALLRRVEMGAGGSPHPPTPADGRATAAAPPPAARMPPTLRSGDLTIDLAGRTVTLRGGPVALPPKEFDLLAFLAQHPGQVFSREALLDRVWGYDFVGGTRTVDVHVRGLRAKLEPDAAEPQLIQTVYGVGYKFGLPVERAGG